MTELTDEQRAFLNTHGIPLSAMFDASGMRTAAYQRAMKEADKSFAYGVTPCIKAGHRLRTRAGHCIQCDHSKIAYMLRYDGPANVYIGGSKRSEVLKIGSSGLVSERCMLLNSYRYGGHADWKMLAWAFTPAAGRVEFDIHNRLGRYSTSGEYVQGGVRRSCYELFRCNFTDALDALRASLPNGVEIKIPDERGAHEDYNFRPE
jgi:hypothetical protein